MRRAVIDYQRLKAIVAETRRRFTDALIAIDYFDRRFTQSSERLMDPGWPGPYGQQPVQSILIPLEAENLPRRRAVCVMIRNGWTAECDELRERFKVNVTTSLNGLVEISNSGVDKSDAMRHVCAELRVPLSEVVAFGDMHNDIELVQDAGLGVAVKNATPRLIRVADRVAPSNEDDGVAQIVSELLASGSIERYIPNLG
jgi:HAD superfamily hydrolase (TIGR01484 family)